MKILGLNCIDLLLNALDHNVNIISSNYQSVQINIIQSDSSRFEIHKLNSTLSPVTRIN